MKRLEKFGLILMLVGLFGFSSENLVLAYVVFPFLVGVGLVLFLFGDLV